MKIEAKALSIKDFFAICKDETKFLIPDYQRPYSWTQENVTTFFDDLWDAYDNKIEGYFIGNIIIFKNNDQNYEIIDGQQRTTTILLLLRAIYYLLEKTQKLNEKSKNSDEIEILKEKIEQIIWTKNKKSRNVNKNSFRIKSNVIDMKNMNILDDILKNGSCESKLSTYCLNYKIFINILQEKTKNKPDGMLDFYWNILDEINILVIELENLESALTIFQTINNRGLQLSDSDIFKSIIYKKLTSEKEKGDFINKWKELSDKISKNNYNFEKIFTYYMFYLRALSGDISIRTPGLRKYFIPLIEKGKIFLSKDITIKIDSNKIINDLNEINNFFVVINQRKILENQEWTNNFEVLKELDIISSYPNEFWKYPVVCYYMAHRNQENFANNFKKFLSDLSLKLLVKYLEVPTSNAIKDKVLLLNKEIINNKNTYLKIDKLQEDQIKFIKNKIMYTPKNLTKMIIKVLAYDFNEQKELLPDKWEIEHIIPQRWSRLNESTKEVIEMIGNKLPLENSINKVSSDKILDFKFNEYKDSKIRIVLDFMNQNKELKTWDKNNVSKRSQEISEIILNKILNKWKGYK
ncbi:DUF262 domain-containing protein [Mycoplasma leonicaptivi]|uniref:DUF262 domain-containing protein n=1 Tax=Mycoplasma leonicaptivi TaxID=36742 RepID=UPI000486F128|nr:DUF262 domain-containing protein [Mycoplasma leonicaptivi]